VFTATATYAAYHIDYYDGVDNTNTIATQDNAYNTSSTVVLNPVYSGGATGPTRSGLSGDTYTFIKWCDAIPTADANNYFPATVCSGNSYDLNGTITIDPTEYSTNINLYAYWDPTTFDEAYLAAGKTKSGSYYMMQDMDANICHNITVNEVSQLTDTRSGNYTYYVAKLKDNKCWMVQNLRLGTNTTSLALTSADSNVSSNFTLNNKVTNGVMPYTSCAVGSCEDRHTSTTYYYNGNAYYCTPVSGNKYVGCYYNWYSATAGTGTSSITPGTSGWRDVNSSICPKGWYLPTGGTDRSNSDFQVLYNNYPSAGAMLVDGTTTYDNTTGKPAPGLLLSGDYYSGGADGVGTDGLYWSRSAWSKGFASYLRLNSSAVYPQSYHHKYDGFSVRCLAYGS
ncbi:MAG: FISUMP domain-containing protein, partial [Candidatus Saccharibacteria bacterium]|nr:FISUMP domain-containing protein [Candidatus Saccharibacteria bacterium]